MRYAYWLFSSVFFVIQTISILLHLVSLMYPSEWVGVMKLVRIRFSRLCDSLGKQLLRSGVSMRVEKYWHIPNIIEIVLRHLLLNHLIDPVIFYNGKGNVENAIDNLVNTMMSWMSSMIVIIFHIINNKFYNLKQTISVDGRYAFNSNCC